MKGAILLLLTHDSRSIILTAFPLYYHMALFIEHCSEHLHLISFIEAPILALILIGSFK